MLKQLSTFAGWVSIATLAALPGCGGAGSQNTPPVPPAMPAAARAPGPSPSAAASLLYTGSLQESGSNGHTTLIVTQHVTSSQATYRGRPVTEYDGVETQSGSGSNSKATFSAYVGQVASKIRTGTDVELLEAKSSDSTGVVQTTRYGAGNGVFDQLPEVPQARWNDTAARTVAIADSFAGSSIDDTYHADGSYDENSIPVEGRTASSQSYADGNGVYQWPFDGGSINSTISFMPPVHGNIQIVFANGLQHITQLITVGTWYPSVPPLLASDTFANEGLVQLPASCKVPKHFGGTATEIVENVTHLDLVFGEYESTQRTSYVEAPYGLVCLNLHDELDVYYDYDADALSSTPLTTEVTDEILGLQQAHVSKSAAIAATGVALPLDARFVALQAARRLKTARAIFHSLQHLRKNR